MLDGAALILPLRVERVFNCLTPDNTYSHAWRVNRTVVTSNSTFRDVVCITSETFSNGSTQGSLTFRAYGQANNTDIECFVTNGDLILLQLDYVITLQGTLYNCSFNKCIVNEWHNVILQLGVVIVLFQVTYLLLM